jgi:purine-binding chemotaxis protein CheW
MSVAQHLVKAADAAITQYLTFMVGDEAFGIGILSIREIIDYGTVTKVPMMPDSIRGVINLRGAVVPVMDLNARFGKGAMNVGRRTCIVIIEVETAEERQVIGLMVDSVSAVLNIPEAEVESVPSFGVGVRAEFIQGMARLKHRFVIILDVLRTFELRELEGADWQAHGATAADAGADDRRCAAPLAAH